MRELIGKFNKKAAGKALPVILTLVSLSFLPAFAAQKYQPYQTLNPYGKSNQSLEHVVLSIPAGATIQAVTDSEINTHFLILGQGISLSLTQDYYYNNKLAAPAGSIINGTVLKLKNISEKNKKALLQIKFTNIISPYGQVIPIYAIMKTDDRTGILKSDTDIVIPANSSITLELVQPITINTSNEYRY